MREAAIDALAMQNALKQAVENNEFSVVYQPIYSIATGEICGAEALVRWLHPELGQVSPDRFIFVAEDIGVMQEGCAELQRWKAEFPELKLHLNINVSGTDLLDRYDSGFEREVLTMLLDAHYRVRPQVEVGGFRIDMVVEGAEDRRPAIELDGNAFHGPEVWERDMFWSTKPDTNVGGNIATINEVSDE